MPRAQRTRSSGFTLLFALPAMAACQLTSPDLEPAAGSVPMATVRDAASAEENGIAIVVDGAEWPGRALIREEVTPLKVTVFNRSSESVVLRLSDLWLKGTSGAIYRPIPARDVRGTVLEQGRKHRPIDVADPGTLGNYDDWYRIDLPTRNMIERSLPEGVLGPGEDAEGFVYFERVDDNERHVLFEAVLSAPLSDAPVARLSIPFEVFD